MSKTLDNSCIADVTKNVKDIKVIGDGDQFKLLSKNGGKKIVEVLY